MSILSELGPEDECIVVDDGSKDGTLAILRSVSDSRVRVYENAQNIGHVGAFERAMSLSSKEVIVLADQDDRWLEGRISLLVSALRKERCAVVTSNATYMRSDGTPVQHLDRIARPEDSRRSVKNILDILTGRSMYFGCAMAFKRELLSMILPIPRYVESHDLWIALAGNLLGQSVHIRDVTLVRRIHGGNATNSRRRWSKKVKSRLVFVRSIGALLMRAGTWRVTGVAPRIP